MEVTFTERELDVMAVLWDMGSATVAEVREKLEEDFAYTTVLTVLRTLEAKGYVGHREEGKAHRYAPLVARTAAGQSALHRITEKVFSGSTELLFTQLVSGRKLKPDELKRMRQLIDHRLKETKK
ncbi:MAG TPA: BlaI/MecI/CopY family transcriptional regulator [Gemmatimonadaceae bacterium]|nr:BlaI/MecI/CopY family transcriptional regulator [Gemmatimonadaceae bacterium]